MIHDLGAGPDGQSTDGGILPARAGSERTDSSRYRRSLPSPVVLIPGANPEAPFVRDDRAILDTLVPVEEVVPGRGALACLRFAWTLHRLCRRRRPRLVASWFAAPGYGTVARAVARAHGVRLLVISGGADVANQPDGFGEAGRPMRRRLVRRILEAADVVWAFSRAAARELEVVARPRRLEVVPPPVDTGFFRPASIPRERLVLSASAAINRITLRQKGIARVMAVARELPDVPFAIVGCVERSDPEVERAVAAAPKNVRWEGFVSRETLRDLYARATVFLQLSTHEGFGVAIAEAVAMGCVPVVSDLAAVREVIGSNGVVVPFDAKAADIAREIARVLAEPARVSDGWPRIHDRFGLDVRRRAWARELGIERPVVGERS